MNHLFTLSCASLFSCASLLASTTSVDLNLFNQSVDVHLLLNREIEVSKWSDHTLTPILTEIQTSLPTPCFFQDYLFAMGAYLQTHPNYLPATKNNKSITQKVYDNTTSEKVAIDTYIDDIREQDPGYGFHRVNALSQLYLEYLHTQANSFNRIIKTADVGAGYGWMASLALCAGAPLASKKSQNGTPLRGVHVTAFENHAPLVGTKENLGPLMNLFKNAKEMSTMLANSGASVRDYSLVINQDAVTALGATCFSGAFDCIYLGHMIHYLTPTRADLLATNLYKAINAKGRIFAIVHTDIQFPVGSELASYGQNGSNNPTTSNETPFTVYQKQVEEGAKFPGWMMLDMRQTYTHAGKHTGSYFSAIHPLNESLDNYSPIERIRGPFLDTDPFAKAREATIKTNKNILQASHRSYLIFDSVSFSELFIRAGFVIEDLFYTDASGARVEVNTIGTNGRFSCAEDTDLVRRVCVIAHKPTTDDMTNMHS